MSQTKAQLLDNIKDNVQLDARNSLRFADTDSSHYVAFKAPATVSSNVTWTLPAADGSANYVLATDGSGTLSWIADPAGQWVTSGSNIYFTGGNVGIGDSSPSNPLSVTGASAFNGDVTFTGASYNVTWDKSDNSLEFADSAKAVFGTGADLEIYHASNHSNIINKTGNLYINASASDTSIVCKPDGAVELYYDNSKKFETANSGLLGADNNRIMLGDGSDLQLWFDATNSIIDHTPNSGTFYIRGNALALTTSQSTPETYLLANSNGAVELYYNNIKTFETASNGTIIRGTEANAGVIYLYADEGDDNADKWRHLSHPNGTYYLQNFAAGSWEDNITAAGNGSVELYYDNAKKFETTSLGTKITGDLWLDNPDTAGRDIQFDSSGDKLKFDDNVKANFGSGDDLSIYHDGSHSRINCTDGGDGRLIISGRDGNANDIGLQLNAEDSKESILCKVDGAVELYHNASKKLETSSTGIWCSGYLSGEGLDIADNKKLLLGSGDDFEIYHDGSNSILLDNGTGNLKLYSNGAGVEIQKSDGENMAKFLTDGAVELYYDNLKRLSTTGTGISVNRQNAGEYFIVNANYGSSGDQAIECSGDLTFYTNASSIAARLDQDGLKFNADTAAANALNDYEEGTWTPTIEGSSNKSISTNHSATYVKIGCLVHCQCYIVLTGTGNSSVFLLGTLPFTNRSNGYSTNVTDFGKGGRKGAYARVNAGTTYAEFLYSSEDPANDRVTIKGQDVGNGYLITNISYMTDA